MLYVCLWSMRCTVSCMCVVVMWLFSVLNASQFDQSISKNRFLNWLFQPKDFKHCFQEISNVPVSAMPWLTSKYFKYWWAHFKSNIQLIYYESAFLDGRLFWTYQWFLSLHEIWQIDFKMYTYWLTVSIHIQKQLLFMLSVFVLHTSFLLLNEKLHFIACTTN